MEYTWKCNYPSKFYGTQMDWNNTLYTIFNKVMLSNYRSYITNEGNRLIISFIRFNDYYEYIGLIKITVPYHLSNIIKYMIFYDHIDNRVGHNFYVKFIDSPDSNIIYVETTPIKII